MDLYFVVAELEFGSPEAASAWRAATLPPTKRHPKGTSLDAVLASAEGPLRIEVRGALASVRAFLVDAAYFMIKDELEAACRLAPRGRWYSGDQVAGRLTTPDGASARAAVHTLPAEMRAWIAEASQLDAPPPDDRGRVEPTRGLRARGRPDAKARSKTTQKTKTAKKTRGR